KKIWRILKMNQENKKILPMQAEDKTQNEKIKELIEIAEKFRMTKKKNIEEQTVILKKAE
ncbi:MAG TPA: hypothetical protein PLS71_21880, partial [Leptospiraceae bacterium]|nr:hypothetical protein [Leptospiraceae bacterium]